ncbi:poly [adp-ribose] polymerase [Holotrichia oblita]|uniref:Poly [adp-ribose] polymerase n=1 Tax=Holotrichia oblita TaxID=644536 RepID=A0ACB9SRD3_HOLOL|nr:poly [adp-ribose] polymerase [Holotrichia oblita]
MKRTYPSTEGACSNKGKFYDNNHNEQVQTKKNVSTGAVPRKCESASESVRKTETENHLMKASPVFKTDISNIMHFIKKSADKLNWDAVSYEANNVHFIKLDQSSEEYLEVQKLFKKTNKRYFKITQIERVQNPFLLAAFLLKKEEMTKRIGVQNYSKLFHGTKNASAMNICKENFDWRLYGQNYGHKFGRGVSFTPISNYATHYSDEDSDDCVMLLALMSGRYPSSQSRRRSQNYDGLGVDQLTACFSGLYLTNGQPGPSRSSYVQAQTSKNRKPRKNPLMKITQIYERNTDRMMDFISDYADELNWDPFPDEYMDVCFLNLHPSSWEYQDVQESFHSTNTNYFTVTRIERIQNPYLLAAFLLKKEEMEERTNDLTVQQLFHGTKNEYVMNICRNNFNWRFNGQNRGHKFGQGVSFTPYSNYATYYGDKGRNNRVMLLAHVLVGRINVGTENTFLPSSSFDTTGKPNGDVIVKYEDNEFYPAYKITYNYIKKQKKQRRRSQRIRCVQLGQYCSEYQEVETLFNRSNKKCFEVMQIERIQNPYLLAAFLLKKDEMTRRTGQQEIKKLFHGTKEASVMDICNDNFDWRCFGKSTGHKFGRGVSFASTANYANNYVDKTCDNQVMFLVHVLVGKTTIGVSSMTLPPNGFDTSIKPNGDVIVKYEDNEFYPAYKIVYKSKKTKKKSKSKRKNNRQTPIELAAVSLVDTVYNDDTDDSYTYYDDYYDDYYYYHNYNNYVYRNYADDEGKKKKGGFFKYVMWIIVITPIVIGVRRWFHEGGSLTTNLLSFPRHLAKCTESIIPMVLNLVNKHVVPLL